MGQKIALLIAALGILFSSAGCAGMLGVVQDVLGTGAGMAVSAVSGGFPGAGMLASMAVRGGTGAIIEHAKENKSKESQDPDYDPGPPPGWSQDDDHDPGPPPDYYSQE